MIILDAFTFFNEYDLLEIRLNELDKYVDTFLICTATTTHSGLPNPYTINMEEERYKKFAHKTCVIQVVLPSVQNGDRWRLENYQRNALFNQQTVVLFGNADFVIVGDVDEIPQLGTWKVGSEGIFTGHSYYYHMNRQHPSFWNGSVILQAWRFISKYGPISPQDARNFRDILQPVGYGQHFSWLGDPQEKVKSFAHDELDKPNFKVDLNYHPADGKELTILSVNNMVYPKYFVDNTDKFKHLVA